MSDQKIFHEVSRRVRRRRPHCGSTSATDAQPKEYQPVTRPRPGLDPARFAIDEIHKGHRWGVVRCLACGMTLPIYSTPRVPEDNARAIRRFADNHDH